MATCLNRKTATPAPLARLMHTLALMSLPLSMPLAATAADTSMTTRDATVARAPQERGSPLVEKVREATKRFRNINMATAEGFVQATPCVSSPNEGAMGIHFLKPDRLHDGVLKADEPEMLIYEPLPGNQYRLVGVEYLVLATDWAAHNPPGTAPSIDGHLANFVGEPNRYALPAFYEMHVWAWEDNPSGSFADFNQRVTCAKQPSPT